MEWINIIIAACTIIGTFIALGTYINKKFDKLDKKFDKIDERFDKIDERFDKIDKRFTKIEQDLVVIKTVLVMKNILPKTLTTNEEIK